MAKNNRCPLQQECGHFIAEAKRCEQAENARNLRYKKAALASLGWEYIRSTLTEIMDACSETSKRKEREAMTYEDVKNIRKSPTHSIVDGGSDYKELSRMIDDAIEKQIKKKPLIKYPSAACPEMVFKCPVCKCELDDIAPNNYCPDCGQAIDWSEEE